MQATYPKILHGNAGNNNTIMMTQDGVENERLSLSAKTIGTGTESLTIDADQNCLMMGPVTINCTLTINGTLKVI